MSNYSNYNKKTKIRWIVTGVAIFLAFVMIAGLCLQVFGQGKVKPSEWFKGDNTELSPDTSDISGGAVVSEGGNKNMRIMSAMIASEDYDEYGIDAQSVENAYTLSVTYTPADTTYQQTTYSIAFKNPYSDWAKGKTVTDYATVTQSAVGSKDATLTVLQSFSEQIIVTATNDRNTSIKATVVVDYVGLLDYSVDDYFAGWDDATGSATISVNCVGGDTSKGQLMFKSGTIAPEVDNSITVIFDTSWITSRMTAKGYEWADSVTYEITTELRDGDEWYADIDRILLKAGNRTGGWYDAENAEWRYALSQSLLGNATPEYLNSDSFTIFDNVKIIAHRVYNGVDYGDVILYDGECCLYDWGFFEISATGITTNTSSIVAG